MPNHVHLILVLAAKDGLGYAHGEAHRRYSDAINARNRQTGHLFQGRYGSVAMDDAYFQAAARYVSLNPVKAKLMKKASDWPWSSARAQLLGVDDELVKVKPLLDRISDFAKFLDETDEPARTAALTRGLSVGRPLMDDVTLKQLEAELGRPILSAKSCRKPQSVSDDGQQKFGHW